jgi:nucleotide-binding universal stress UspA family protein
MNMAVQQILVPVDYSDDAAHALQWAASLAEQYRAHLLVLHVIGKAIEEVHPQGASYVTQAPACYEGMAPGSQPFGWQPLIIDLAAQAHTQVQAFAAQHLPRHLAVQLKVAVGKPAEAIVWVAHEAGVDLIVMGTHGRTGVRHLLLGSLAEAVIRRVRCPVMTVRRGVAVAA